MASTAKPIAKGDTLYVLRRYSTQNGVKPYTVESVGRKWIKLEGGMQLDKDTLKGEMLVGYLNMGEYEETLRVERLKRRIVNKLQHVSPQDITTAQLDAIGEILGINGDLATPDQ